MRPVCRCMVLSVFLLLSTCSVAPMWADEQVTTLRSCLPDTDLHTLAGLSICFLAAGAMNECAVVPVETTTIAVSTALVAGVAKELVDMAGYGTPEVRDFFNTALGGAVAGAGLLFAYRTLMPVSEQSRDTTVLFSSLGVVFLIPLVAYYLRRLF